MNKITVKSPIVRDNKITYSYNVDGEWSEAFDFNNEFFIEYNRDISSVPEGIAVIPLICNILPAAWLYDAEIVVPKLDKTFYNSIPEFKKGYMDMYPSANFKGRLTVEELEENIPAESSKSACFFSGGVDAFNTLIMHHGEHPDLITLWGADVKLSDTDGWKNVETHVKETSEKFGVDYIIVKSSFRMFMNFHNLERRFKESIKGNWWHELQHGIGIISHGAPVAYLNGYSQIYIASSYTAADKGNYTCASDPTIDNFVRFGETNIVHDGYEFIRQDKIRNIIDFSRMTGVKPFLRVCWITTGGKNCCECEKCWRTALAVMSEKEDAREYGFYYTNEQLKNVRKILRLCKLSRKNMIIKYQPIQDNFRKNYKIKELPKEIRWFYKINIGKLTNRTVPMLIRDYSRALIYKIVRK